MSVDANGAITFVEDIDVDTAVVMKEDAMQDLFDSGILEKGGSSDGRKSRYELAEENFEGNVFLDKDELKTASLIGYYQPLLQSDLVTMIGSKAYTHVTKLKELELIESEREGRSYVLKTTPGFARFFGIEADDQAGIKKWLADKLGMQ